MINLDKFRMGYFILWKNQGGFVGNGIEIHQKGCGFSAEESKWVHIDVSGGGQWAVRVNPPATKVVDIIKTYPERHFKVVRFKDDEYEARLRYKVAFWAASNCNKKYDFMGILKMKIPFLWHRKDLFFCSENSLWSLQKEVPNATGKKPYNCMPADFLNPNYFEVVYEGIIPEAGYYV